jgi:hypothetical protein
MLSFRNVVIKHTEVKDGQYDSKKNKYVKYKKAKTIVKTVSLPNYSCGAIPLVV